MKKLSSVSLSIADSLGAMGQDHVNSQADVLPHTCTWIPFEYHIISIFVSSVARAPLLLQLMKKKEKTYCRCLGVSGSCTTKICYDVLHHAWQVLPAVLNSFHKARRVTAFSNKDGTPRIPIQLKLFRSRWKNNAAVAKRRGRRGIDRPRSSTIVYHSHSLDYCRKNTKRGWPGVAGRVCNLTTSVEEEQCRYVCCSNDFHIETVRKISRKDCGFTKRNMKVECKVHFRYVKQGRCKGWCICKT